MKKKLFVQDFTQCSLELPHFVDVAQSTRAFSLHNVHHSVLAYLKKNGSDLNQRLPQHESLYPIGLKSARIEIPHIGSHYLDFSKTDFY